MSAGSYKRTKNDYKILWMTLPTLSIKAATNVIAWSRLREIVINFKAPFVKSGEIILGAVMLMYFLSAIYAVILLVIGNPFSPFNYYASIVGVLILFFFEAFVGIYIGKFGLGINTWTSTFHDFFIEQTFILKSQAVLSGDKTLSESADICYHLGNFLEKTDHNFCILGVAVTPALLQSVATSLVVSIGSALLALFEIV